jgi:threonine dehydrogenase-like Zn-dependent dehydrogenase
MRAPQTLPAKSARSVYDIVNRTDHPAPAAAPTKELSAMTLPTTSRAIAVDPAHPGRVHRTEVAVPAPGPTEVMVKTIRVGVCGTDREIIHGIIGAPPAGASELVIGHEVLGRVIATGDQVTDLKTGDIVTATVRRPDGCPACAAGQPDMCLWGDYRERGIVHQNGYMTEYWVEDREWVIPIPQALAHVGVLVEPLTVVEKAVRQVEIMQRRMPWWTPKTAVVLGTGPIGILGTLLLRSRDVAVTAVARSEKPTAASNVIEGAGAEYVSTRHETLDALRQRLGNIDVVIESTGASSIVFDAMGMLNRDGVLALLSVTATGTTSELDAGLLNNGLVAGNNVVVGSVNSGLEDFHHAVDNLGRFEQLWPGLLDQMFTERIPFDGDIDSIVGKAAAGIKTVIEFE